MKMKYVITAALALLNSLALGQPTQEKQADDSLPEGRWTGKVTNKTIPDVDNDGEWQQEVALVHCGGQVTIQFKGEDGRLEPAFPVTARPYRNMFTLLRLGAGKADFSTWIESQIWTLVDARPKGWTLGQSGAVLNRDKKPEDPWFTFHRFAWGNMQYDSQWCSRKSGAPQ